MERALIVEIIEKKTGKVVARLPIVLRGMNYAPNEKELFNTAWQTVVEDKSVDPKNREYYDFRAMER